jgi:hypothetical protein
LIGKTYLPKDIWRRRLLLGGTVGISFLLQIAFSVHPDHVIAR